MGDGPMSSSVLPAYTPTTNNIVHKGYVDPFLSYQGTY